MALGVLSRFLLNSSRDGDATISLGRLFQCLITLPVRKFLLMSNQSQQGMSLHGAATYGRPLGTPGQEESPKLQQSRFRLDSRGNFLHGKGDQTPKRAAQGDVHGNTGRGPQCPGVVDTVMLGPRLGSMRSESSLSYLTL